jgi:hypothetical protein
MSLSKPIINICNKRKKNNLLQLISSVFRLVQRFNSFGAGGGTRTHTPLLTTDFESAPSTNSSTPAL